MNPWGTYCSRIESKGSTKREARLRREARTLTRKYPDSLAYHEMTIDDVARSVLLLTRTTSISKRSARCRVKT